MLLIIHKPRQVTLTVGKMLQKPFSAAYHNTLLLQTFIPSVCITDVHKLIIWLSVYKLFILPQVHLTAALSSSGGWKEELTRRQLAGYSFFCLFLLRLQAMLFSNSFEKKKCCFHYSSVNNMSDNTTFISHLSICSTQLHIQLILLNAVTYWANISN